MQKLTVSAITLLLFAGVCQAQPTSEFSASGSRYAVASVQPLATEAAMEVFREGGNAVDAAVTAALTLSVVDNHNSGIGGGCLILVRTPDGKLIAIDGRETAPAAAHRDMYLVDGEADSTLSQTGPLASGTPGALAAYAMLVEQAGSKPLARLLEPGMRHARDGFHVDKNYATRLKSAAKTIARFPGSKAQLLKENGEPYQEGELLVQPDLAKTYQGVIESGPDWFYRGPLAKAVGDWMAENGGVLTAEDFAAYEAKAREPVVSTYRGLTVVGFPPPSSGGVHVAQMLNMLEGFKLGEIMRRDHNEAVHLIAEAMKLAFADRAHWLGDSDFAKVPRGLASKSYADSLASKINLGKSTPVPSHGEPPEWRQDLFGRHTTHVTAADAEGYWVAITATVNTGFGSKVIVPGTGVVLNNEMDDFSIHPGTPNAFGLIGAENNSVQPGKRPLSSMSPTIVLDENGEPLLTVGAAGGPRIITQVLLAITGVVDGGMTLAEAIAQPRWHHQWRPDKVGVEKTTAPEVVDSLSERGHLVETLKAAGVSQGIQRSAEGGLIAVRDPRVAGRAAAE